MNNIDTIIKYLSGDLEMNARTDFEKTLKTDSTFSEEYMSVLEIWNTMQEQLRLEELPDEKNREEFIAEVIAAYDVEHYRSASLSKKEQAFKEDLAKVMLEEASDKEKNRRPVKVIYRLTLLVAAAAAITLLLSLPGSNLKQLANDYYTPLDDRTLDQYKVASRAEESNGIYLFSVGNYKAARITFEKELESFNDTEKLFYALACKETGDPEQAISILNDLLKAPTEVANQATWYLSLIYIQYGKLAEAQNLLEELTGKDVIYHKKTKKLLRRME